MATSAKNRNVDFKKLNNEFRKRGLNCRRAAIRMGRSETYFGGMKQKGYLSESTLVMLDSLWNIKYEDIEPIKVEEPSVSNESEKVEEVETFTMSKDELRFIITEAVKDAFTWYANL